MRLTFDINTEKESTNLHIEFDDKERATGRWGKLLALEYLTYSLIENTDEELSTRIFDFTAKELEKQKNLNLES